MLYGVAIRSGFHFRNELIPTTAPPDVTFTRSVGPPEIPAPGTLAWDSRSTSAGRPAVYFWRVDGGFVLRFEDVSSFTVRPDRIQCRARRATDDSLVELQFLGLVLALWLEERGRTVLHASAIESRGRITAFLGGRGAGKTSLAAAFTRRGHRLLTEDVLALEVLESVVTAHAGYPVMRMWPDTAAEMAPGVAGQRVHHAVTKLQLPVPGSDAFSTAPRTLERMYILDRRPSEEDTRGIAIQPIDGAQTIVELVRHSFDPELVHVMGLHRHRFWRLARIAGCVPLFRLSFPSGYDRIGDVTEMTASRV